MWNKKHYAKEKVTQSESTGVIHGCTEMKFMKEIFKIKEFWFNAKVLFYAQLNEIYILKIF